MKTSWLNGSKRILSALLIAAALMLGWTPLGEGKALAATDKGKQFAQAAMLFAKSDTDFAQDMYGAKGTDNNQIFQGGAWCAAFISVVARQIGIPTSIIPNTVKAYKEYCPSTGETHADWFHCVIDPNSFSDYKKYAKQYDPNYVPQPGDIITLNTYKSSEAKELSSSLSHVGIVTSYNSSSKMVTFVSGNWSIRRVSCAESYDTTKKVNQTYYGIVGYYHPDWSQVGTLRTPQAVTGITLKNGSSVLSENTTITMNVDTTLKITSSVSPSNAFYPNPSSGVYRYFYSSPNVQIASGYTGLFWQSSNENVAIVNPDTGLVTAVGAGTATITAYAIADGKRTRATAVKKSFKVQVTGYPSHEWYTYEAYHNSVSIYSTPSLRSANVIKTIAVGTEFRVDLSHVYAMRARNGWGWLSPVQLNDGTTGYCDLNAHYYVSSAKKDYPTVRPMSEQENAEWWNYKVVWASGLNLRSFADSNATGTVIMKIPKAATVELDLNHTMREPKYGDTWAFARYKQSDGTYVYGWCIESDPEYTQRQERVEQFWYGYVPSQGCVVYVYQAQDIDSNIVAAYTADDYFQLEFNNTYRDNSGHFWAAAADNFGTEIGYVDLNDEYSSSGSITMYPSVTFISATEQHYAEVKSTSGIVAKVTPFDSAPTVFTLPNGATFWHGELATYTDAAGQQWIPIYGQRYFDGYECCGWIKADEAYLDVRQYAEYVRSYSANGKTYKLFDGPMSWSDALSMAVDIGASNHAVNQTLAMIRNDDETEAVRVLLGSGNIDYAWLGAYSSDGLNWTWMDGSPMNYNQWMSGCPSEWPESRLAAYCSGEWTLFSDAPQMAVQGFITEQFTGIGLPQVKLPASTFYVDDEAFVGNSTIQAVVAPDGLQVIGTRAFADCANLKCITLPDSVSHIAEDAFENTPDVVIFASVGSYAWQWAEKQDIPHGTPYIE